VVTTSTIVIPTFTIRGLLAGAELHLDDVEVSAGLPVGALVLDAS
jgi:hypothetical protein